VLIVDNKSDLNVYTDVTQSTDSNKKGTCCGNDCKVEVTAGDPMSQFKDIDFNEWAGPRHRLCSAPVRC